MTLENIKLHVFEPDDSVYKDSWYKDPNTFSFCKCFDNISNLLVGDIIEDDMGTRFRILSRHWKFVLNPNTNVPTNILEFTLERYMRHGKQNPYMI